MMQSVCIAAAAASKSLLLEASCQPLSCVANDNLLWWAAAEADGDW
jgi:hypothetical protein